MSSPPPPAPTGSAPAGSAPLSIKTTALSVLTLAGAVGLIVYAYYARQPQTVSVLTPVIEYQARTQRVETEIEVNGKKQKVTMEVPVPVTETKYVTETRTAPLTWDQTVRLGIVTAAGVLITMFTVLVFGSMFYISVYQEKETPKYLHDWAERVFGVLVGLVIGFMSGNTVGDTTNKGPGAAPPPFQGEVPKLNPAHGPDPKKLP